MCTISAHTEISGRPQLFVVFCSRINACRWPSLHGTMIATCCGDRFLFARAQAMTGKLAVKWPFQMDMIQRSVYYAQLYPRVVNPRRLKKYKLAKQFDQGKQKWNKMIQFMDKYSPNRTYNRNHRILPSRDLAVHWPRGRNTPRSISTSHKTHAIQLWMRKSNKSAHDLVLEAPEINWIWNAKLGKMDDIGRVDIGDNVSSRGKESDKEMFFSKCNWCPLYFNA
jgi:hypothetical protein